MSRPAFTIERLAAADLDAVEPLWNDLREHHAAAAPDFGPPRSREDSWNVRRASYEQWLAIPTSFCLVARDDAGQAIGYAMVKIDGPEAIWATDISGSLETLSVRSGTRSLGVGSALIGEVRAELARRGIKGMSIHVLHPNEAGHRFYARHGFETVVDIVWGDTKP